MRGDKATGIETGCGIRECRMLMTVGVGRFGRDMGRGRGAYNMKADLT